MRVRDIRGGMRTKAEKEILHYEGGRNGVVLWVAADVVTVTGDRDGSFAFIDTQGNIVRYRYHATQHASTTSDHSKNPMSSFQANAVADASSPTRRHVR